MPFGSRFVGIEVGANSIRGVALRKMRGGFRVVAAEKLDRDPAAGKILEFPEGGGPMIVVPEVAALLRRLGRGAKQTAVAVPDVEVLLRHLPIPRSAGENLQPLIRAVLAAPTEGEVTFTYRRLTKAAPAPDHDLVLVAASRGEELRRLVAGLKDCGVKVKGLTPYPQALLSLAQAASAEVPATTGGASSGSQIDDEGPVSGEENVDAGGGSEGAQDTFVFLDEGGPLFAIAPDSDLRAVTFALIEEGDLLFARRSPLTSMSQEKGRPADGVGVISEIIEQANQTLDLAKGTLKRSDLVPGDIRVFGRRRVCQELANAMTGKMGAPVRIVPPEVWGSVTVQPGVVFDPGDYAIALGLAMSAAEEEFMFVPPSGQKVERLGVSGRMRILAAGTALGFVFLPALQAMIHKQRQEENLKVANQQMDSARSEAERVTTRANQYGRSAEQYGELLGLSQEDGGVGTLASLFDASPPEVKFSSLRVVPADQRAQDILPGKKRKMVLTMYLDVSGRSANAILQEFLKRLDEKKIADPGSISAPRDSGMVKLLKESEKSFQKIEFEFVTPEDNSKAGKS